MDLTTPMLGCPQHGPTAFTEDVLSHLWEVIDSEGQRHTIAEGAGVGGGDRGNAWTLVENHRVGMVAYIWIGSKLKKSPYSGGGFKYFLLSSLPGEMIQFD